MPKTTPEGQLPLAVSQQDGNSGLTNTIRYSGVAQTPRQTFTAAIENVSAAFGNHFHLLVWH